MELASGESAWMEGARDAKRRRVEQETRKEREAKMKPALSAFDRMLANAEQENEKKKREDAEHRLVEKARAEQKKAGGDEAGEVVVNGWVLG